MQEHFICNQRRFFRSFTKFSFFYEIFSVIVINIIVNPIYVNLNMPLYIYYIVHCLESNYAY